MIARIFAMLVLFLFLVSLGTLILMACWNDVIVDVFSAKTIGFWQAFELSLLAGIFIKGTSGSK